MSKPDYDAAYAAFLREFDDWREQLTFAEEDAIRAAVRAALVDDCGPDCRVCGDDQALRDCGKSDAT